MDPTTEELEREERRKARANWPVRKGTLAELEGDDYTAPQPLRNSMPAREAESASADEVVPAPEPEAAEQAARALRKAARAHWPVRKGTFAELDADDEYSHFTPQERVDMMWRITQDAFSVARRNPKS